MHVATEALSEISRTAASFLNVADGRVTRRGSLVKLGGAGLAAALGWKAVEASGAGPAAVASGAVSCVLAPEQTEGPFSTLKLMKVRSPYTGSITMGVQR